MDDVGLREVEEPDLEVFFETRALRLFLQHEQTRT